MAARHLERWEIYLHARQRGRLDSTHGRRGDTRWMHGTFFVFVLRGFGCLTLHSTSVEDEAYPWPAANVVVGEASSNIQWLMCWVVSRCCILVALGHEKHHRPVIIITAASSLQRILYSPTPKSNPS